MNTLTEADRQARNAAFCALGLRQCDAIEAAQSHRLRADESTALAGAILEEFKRSHASRLDKLTTAYRRARDRGTLREGLEPRAMALDTMSFFEGALRRYSLEAGSGLITRHLRKMIHDHIALRRRPS